MLETLCGKDGYQLTILTSEFTVRVRVALTVRKQSDSVRELLERILPYNMIFSVELLYNIWQQFKSYTWAETEKFTWTELKEEVLPNGSVY